MFAMFQPFVFGLDPPTWLRGCLKAQPLVLTEPEHSSREVLGPGLRQREALPQLADGGVAGSGSGAEGFVSARKNQ